MVSVPARRTGVAYATGMIDGLAAGLPSLPPWHLARPSSASIICRAKLPGRTHQIQERSLAMRAVSTLLMTGGHRFVAAEL